MLHNPGLDAYPDPDNNVPTVGPLSPVRRWGLRNKLRRCDAECHRRKSADQLHPRVESRR
jgi:hypothetical protein